MKLVDYREEMAMISDCLNRIRNATTEQYRVMVKDLCQWSMEHFDKLCGDAVFLDCYRLLVELIPLVDTPEQDAVLRRRCFGELAAALRAFLMGILHNPIQIFLLPETAGLARFFYSAQQIGGPSPSSGRTIREARERGCFCLLISEDIQRVPPEIQCETDQMITSQMVMDHVTARCPIDSFIYDRLFLAGKFKALRQTLTRIWIAGSSYAMVGVKESRMPYPALNAAVNAQDVYYSLLCAQSRVAVPKNYNGHYPAGILLFLQRFNGSTVRLCAFRTDPRKHADF